MAKNQQKQIKVPSIVLTIESINPSSTGFLVNLRAQLIEGLNPIVGAAISFYHEGINIGSGVTDLQGNAVCSHALPLISEDTIVLYEAANGLLRDKDSKIVPKIKKPESTSRDAKRIRLSYSATQTPGVFRVHAHIVSSGGARTTGEIVFHVGGIKHTAPTDQNGYAEVPSLVVVAIDEVVTVTATINQDTGGVEGTASIDLKNPGPVPEAHTWEWFASFRGVAGICRWAMMLFTIILLSVIIFNNYDPILMPHHSELSVQQQMENEIIDQPIELPKSQGIFPTNTVLWCIFLWWAVLVFSLIVNLRKINNAFYNVFNKLSNQLKGNVADPWSERIFNFYKVVSEAHSKNEEEKEEYEKSGPNFSKFIASGIVAEVIGGTFGKLFMLLFPKFNHIK